MTLFDDFTWRGLVYDATDGLADLLRSDRVTAYIGFDPTASSLHVGSLLPLMALARLQRFGHRAIALMGGGTGMIGDPSGKSQERQLLTRAQIDANVEGIRTQVSRLLEFDTGPNPARLLNNAEWLAAFDLLGFLRDTGKHFTVNYMLAKESVKRRLESEEGISFTEFSYLLLQARDFLELFDREGCRLQLGGSDQWGNITAGIDLIRKFRGQKAHGLVMPLVTTASGVKFGKTEAGTIWLDAERTSPFAFYQFWLNTDDRDVVRYLKYFTFLEADAVDDLERALRAHPERRQPQRVLAREVTTLVHGGAEAERAAHSSAALFSANLRSAGAADLIEALREVPSTIVTMAQLQEQLPLTHWLSSTGLVQSRSEATRLIRSGGVYVNDQRVTDEKRRLSADDLVDKVLIVLGKGQRQKHVLKIDQVDTTESVP